LMTGWKDSHILLPTLIKSFKPTTMTLTEVKQAAEIMDRCKVHVEINSTGDGRIFINYWNWKNGNDVVCELVNGNLIYQYKDDDEEKEQPITIQEFVKMVLSRAV